jgi:hypothetical protein
MERMTDERLAEFAGIHLDSAGYGPELLQAMKAERKELKGSQRYGSALSKEICGQNIQIDGMKEQIKLLKQS